MIREILNLLFAETQAQIDDRALEQLIDFLAIDKEETIHLLQHRTLTWAERIPSPARDQLDESADFFIQRATRKATFRGAVAGSVGFLALLPEQFAHWAQMLRLLQRLAIVYGINLDSQAGQTTLLHSFAYLYEVPVPSQHELTLKMSDLAKSLQYNPPDSGAALQFIIRQIVRRTLTRQGKKIIPGIGVIIGAVDGYREMQKMGARGKKFYSKRYRTPYTVDNVEEALELPVENP